MVITFGFRRRIPTHLQKTILMFDPNSRFESGLVRGRWFITSHIIGNQLHIDGVPDLEPPRIFCIHEGQEDGTVVLCEVEGQSRWYTLAEARRAIRKVKRK